MEDDIDLTPLLERIGAIVKEKAIEMCPIDMGDLRRSIDFKVEGNTVTIFSELDYAEDMEYGTPPEPLSEKEKEDITAWAHRHGLKSGKGIIKKIEKSGIKAGTTENPLHVTGLGRDSYRPFLRPAVHQSMPKIIEMIKEEFSE